MDFIFGFVSALFLVGVFFLGAFYGIYITEKTNKNESKNEVDNENDKAQD